MAEKSGNIIIIRFGIYNIPVNFVIIDNQIVISKVIQECGLKPGDIVLKVGDESIEEILNDRRKYISQSREDSGSLFYLSLFRTNKKNIDVTVIRDGKTVVVNVKSSQKNISYNIDTKSQAMEDGQIYYINVGLLKKGELKKLWRNGEIQRV